MRTLTSSHCQKAIRKLNNIVIARLTTKRRPNILSKTWRFNTSADWTMLGEEFKTWPADPLPDATLITVGMHVTNLSYLEDGPPCFTQLPDGGMEESNRILVGVDTAAVIPETNNQDLPDLIDSEAEWVNKKKEKAERRRQRKINLAKATLAGGAPSSPDASTRCFPSSPVASADGTSGVSAGGAPLTPVAGGGPSSAVSGRSSSPVAGSSPLSAVSSRPSSSVAGGGPLSAVSGRLSSPVAGGGPLSTVSGRPSPLVAGGGPSSAVLGRPLSLIASGGPLSAVSGRPSSPVPPAGSRVLFLTSTPSRARHFSLFSSLLFHSSLPSLPTPLACNPASLSGKRLFDQAFITQRPIASTRQ